MVNLSPLLRNELCGMPHMDHRPALMASEGETGPYASRRVDE